MQNSLGDYTTMSQQSMHGENFSDYSNYWLRYGLAVQKNDTNRRVTWERFPDNQLVYYYVV